MDPHRRSRQSHRVGIVKIMKERTTAQESVSQRALNPWMPLVGIAVAFVAAVVIVHPLGDFPLNDDWSFALSAWHFADTGEFMFARMTAMTLRLQVLWGALWTTLFGKSFEVLRASTLFLTLCTLGMAHQLLRASGVSATLRTLTVLALLFHPVFFLNSFTFMTHVPFVSVSLLALYFFFRALTEDRMLLFAAGCLAVVGSFFIRQTGIANALPPLVAVLLARGSFSPRWKSYLAVISSVIALFVFLFLATDALVGYPGIIDHHYDVWRGTAPEVIWKSVSIPSRWAIYTFMYAGLFMAPLTMPLLLGWRRFTRAEILTFLIVLFPFAIVANELAILHRSLPFTRGASVIANFAMGPLTLRDTFVFDYKYPVHLPHSVLAVLNYAGGFLGALLLFIVLRGWWNHRGVTGKRAVLIQLAAIQSLAATALLGASGIYFDRYVIDATWALFFLLPFMIDWPKRASLLLILAFLVPIATFSVFGVREYFEWNRARWTAFDYLRSRGVTLEQMDGGYEINQYLLGGWHGEVDLRLRGMHVFDDEYILAFNEVSGYESLRSFPYEGFMGLRNGDIHVQKRGEGFRPEFMIFAAPGQKPLLPLTGKSPNQPTGPQRR